MKRTIDNCRLIKQMKSEIGEPERQGEKCLGYAGNTDEPCETCKKCRLNTCFEFERMM